jgi:hypothetical protein
VISVTDGRTRQSGSFTVVLWWWITAAQRFREFEKAVRARVGKRYLRTFTTS